MEVVKTNAAAFARKAGEFLVIEEVKEEYPNGKTVGEPIRSRAAVAPKAVEPLVIEEVKEEYPNSKTAGEPIRCTAAVARKAGEPLVVIEEVKEEYPNGKTAEEPIQCRAAVAPKAGEPLVVIEEVKEEYPNGKTAGEPIRCTDTDAVARKAEEPLVSLLSAMAVKEEYTNAKTAGKPIRCRAAVARKAGEPLVMEEVIVAPPNPHELRIRIICTTLCQSDISFWKLKDPPGYFPRIFGHECVGVVESIGEGVTDIMEGDTVIPTFMADCGECADCKSKKSNICSKIPFEISPGMPRDGTSRFTDLNGETLYHFLYVSSFVEYTVVDSAHVSKIDPALRPDRACLLGCAVPSGVGAVWRTADVEAGSTVVIFGLGAVGLSVAMGARLRGATRIIGVDLTPDKFEMGKKFGVTDFVNSATCTDKRLSEVINEMTGGGADYCFECVGLPSLMQEAFACCRKGWGKTVVLGSDKYGRQLSLSCYEVLHYGKTIMGSLFGGLKTKSDIPILAKLYMDKELQLDEFVTHELGFEEVNKAYDLLIEGKSLRCVIWMNK